MPRIFWVCFLRATLAIGSTPTGLLCDLQRSPAAGVRNTPVFSWIVPPCPTEGDHHQVAYRLVVSTSERDLWDSGKTFSNESTHVVYTGPALASGMPYQWTVTTWTAVKGGASACQSFPSTPAKFITALYDGWDKAAQFISVKGAGTFGYFRKEITVPPGVISAAAFITGVNQDPLLSAYKFYINGDFVGLGPGRGEAPVWDGDGQFRNLPYDTFDVTRTLSIAGKAILAIQGMHAGHGPNVIMQLTFCLKDGKIMTLGTDSSWQAFNGDLHRRPGPPIHGHSAGNGFLEYIDARHEPVGWMSSGFKGGADWMPATAVQPTQEQVQNLHAKMEPPMQVENVPVASIKAIAAPSLTPRWASFLATFEKELQGGLHLAIDDGTAGTIAHIACGESIKGDVVGTTWGWDFNWTLRDGQQVLEQHKYMECRFVTITFIGTAVPSNFTLSAWKTNYRWYDDDSFFTSSNETLNAVWELARYTLNAASLDTYTDSNTRERRPYEADGIIAATSWLLVQRDYLWPRHSHAWVINSPTWPVEWKQLSPFLGWQDFMATGRPDLALAFTEQMYDRTMYKYIDSTGLLNTSKMGQNTEGLQGHIVDWMPDGQETDETVRRGEFTASNHMSVTNMFGAHGLELLSIMCAAGGRSDNATKFSREASSLKERIVANMWDGMAFCDGVCSEVHGNSRVMSHMFSLCFGMVPKSHIDNNWESVAKWGLEQMGDYGAFWYQHALGSGYYSAFYDTPDDGSAILQALTKCDRYSWCSGLRDDNLTMSRESWHDGTYSHAWGTSPIAGIVWGLMGVHQTSPTFANFIVKPKLGSLSRASITVPTIRGYINVSVSPSVVEVELPCNSVATLCMPRVEHDRERLLTRQTHRLMLDGSKVASVENGGHLCLSQGVSCGAGGKSRKLSVQPKPKLNGNRDSQVFV